MRINRGFLGWGVFLVLVGAVPLAVRGGYISEDQIPSVVNLWPLILVGIGIAILLARTRYGFLGGLVVAATFGLIVGSALAGGIEGIRTGSCGPGGGGTSPFPTREGILTGSSGSIDLDLSCGSVAVSVAPGDGWRIEGRDRTGVGPNIDASGDSLRVRSHDDDFFEALSDRETWRVSLPDAPRLDLNLKLNAGSSTVDLGTAAIEGFALDLNAGSAVVDLGLVHELGDLDVGVNAGSVEMSLPSQSFSGTVEANAGSIAVCVPPGAALRIHTSESIVASYDLKDQGLVKQGSTWESPGYDSAAVRIELDAKTNVGSFTLNPEDGCGG